MFSTVNKAVWLKMRASPGHLRLSQSFIRHILYVRETMSGLSPLDLSFRRSMLFLRAVSRGDYMADRRSSLLQSSCELFSRSMCSIGWHDTTMLSLMLFIYVFGRFWGWIVWVVPKILRTDGVFFSFILFMALAVGDPPMLFEGLGSGLSRMFKTFYGMF